MKGKEKHIIIRQSVIFCEHNYQKQMLRTSIFMGLCFYKMIRLCRTLSITFEYVYLITQKFHSLTLHLSLSLQKNQTTWSASWETYTRVRKQQLKRLFSSSSFSAIRVVSSAYLRLLIFLPITPLIFIFFTILIIFWHYL